MGEGDGTRGRSSAQSVSARAGTVPELLSPPEVTIGLVGPHRLLQQIVLAAGLPGPVDQVSWADTTAPPDSGKPLAPSGPGAVEATGTAAETGADAALAAAGQPDTVSAAMNFRLISAPYTSEQSAPERAARLGSADAWLFASRAPLEYARQAGALRRPPHSSSSRTAR